MTAALIVIAVLAAGFVMVTAELVLVRRQPDRVLACRVRQDVVVTLQAGPAFSGVLYEYDAASVVLRNAAELGSDTPLPVDGELLLRWSDIAYCQLP